MDITVATLIYRSPQYLDFVMNSLLDHGSSKHNVRYLIVCNDATQEVIKCADGWYHEATMYPEKGMPIIDHVVHKNKNPNDWWIQNVYNAWNRALKECKTEYICFVNSDMAFTYQWLDRLAALDLDKFIPTSLLVESGRMPSIKGLISKNFGRTLGSFDKMAFEAFARTVSAEAIRLGGAYMPSLFKCDKLRSVGGWSKNEYNIPGDRITFSKLRKEHGLRHISICDSLVYHFQRGESVETGDWQ